MTLGLQKKKKNLEKKKKKKEKVGTAGKKKAGTAGEGTREQQSCTASGGQFEKCLGQAVRWQLAAVGMSD
jgi:hypothetical protein